MSVLTTMNRVDRYYDAHPAHPAHPAQLRRTHNTILMLPPPPLVDSGISSSRSSTWTSYNSAGGGGVGSGFSLLEHSECIKPERSNKRNNIQKLQWRNSRWVDGFPGEEYDQRLSSMTIADVSPRFAVKRIILLYENFQYREAANFINRLNHGTFKAILIELPVDLFVESMPHSLSILEALYAKVFLSDGLNFSMKLLRPDGVIMQMVKFFSSQEIEKASGKWELCGPFICSCKKLLKVIVLSDPKVKKVLQARRRTLDKAIEGLGAHGLVGTTDETLMNLHDALKVEFQRVVETYKGALQKLEELALAGNNNTAVSKGPAPVQASHQRQLSLKKPDIQDRLIKNKTLLNVVEPTLGNHSLDILLGILQRRIDYDKDVLFQFTQLKKEMKDVEAGAVVAPVLMRYSHGCEQVLELMKEVAEDDEDSSDISGYHSDSDSAIMMSGNSPYVSKRARYNFLTRSVRSTSKCSGRPPLILSSGLGSTSSDSPPGSLLGPGRKTMGSAIATSPDNGSTTSSNNSSTLRSSPRQVKLKNQLNKINNGTAVPCCQGCQPRASLQVLPPSDGSEVTALRSEMEALRAELSRANTRVMVVQESERQLKDRLSLCPPPPAPAMESAIGRDVLVRHYADLYNRARVDTLDALDALTQLRDSHELKSKILFSVIVLAFRSAQALLALKRDHVRRILHIPTPPPSGIHADFNTAQLEVSVQAYLRTSVQHFDLTKIEEEVCTQIWATLYDYPCLKSCPGLVGYVKEAVRLAWALVNQAPAYHLEYEQRAMRKDVHVRFHTSNLETEHIRTYLWPALLEGQGGPCVHKAVVIT